MVKLIKYFGVAVLQLAGMAILSYIVCNLKWLSNAVYGACAWGVLPLAGAVSAYLVTLKGVNNYLAWIAPPAAYLVAHYFAFFYMPDSAGPIFTCAVASIIGAAAGDVKKKMKRK